MRLTASVPDKFLDILPKSFLILVILGGFVIASTSPILLIIEKWLPNPLSINETISSIAIILSSSIVAGIPVILLETPIVGDKGLYSIMGKKIHKSDASRKELEKDPTKPNFGFMMKVGFYGWLNQNGCMKFLDQLNLHNSIVNALIVGFTVSSILNLIGVPILVIFNPIMNWVTLNPVMEVIITVLTVIVLVVLVEYNRRWWKPERDRLLSEIGEEYQKYIEEGSKKKLEAERNPLLYS